VASAELGDLEGIKVINRGRASNAMNILPPLDYTGFAASNFGACHVCVLHAVAQHGRPSSMHPLRCTERSGKKPNVQNGS
jgi:hypothetical protein